MKKIMIILIFLSINTWADKGDMDLSLNMGISSGTGLGISYNLTERFRIKVNTLYFANKNEDEFLNLLSVGGSLAFDLNKLKDKVSSVYFFLGTANFFYDNFSEYMGAYSAGLGVRKFIDSNMFFELEFGFGLYNMIESEYRYDYDDEGNYDDYYYSYRHYYTLFSGSVNVGYKF